MRELMTKRIVVVEDFLCYMVDGFSHLEEIGGVLGTLRGEIRLSDCFWRCQGVLVDNLTELY